MDSFQEAKKLIDSSTNIYILPSQEKEESIAGALALFYTLKELKKNVNLLVDEIPERLRFLIPSLDYISYPRNFVIGIPNSAADVSQIRYEKDEKELKICLTVDKGNIKKSDISFCFTEPKADLFITMGLKELKQEQSVPILNIDNQKENKSFGAVNLIEPESLFTEIVFNLIESINKDIIKKEVATALLAGLIISSDNFKNPKTSSKTLEIASLLTKKGALHQEIINNLYNRSLPQAKFLGQILSNLNVTENNGVSFAVVDSPDFQNFGENEVITAFDQLKNNFVFKNLLILWKSHSSESTSRGFFYSENYDLIKKMTEEYQGIIRNNAVFFSVGGQDLDSIKNKTLKIITS